MKSSKFMPIMVALMALSFISGCSKEQASQTTGVETNKTTNASAVELTDEQIDNIVRRTYQYVAMYNVNNKFALALGGWQRSGHSRYTRV